MLSVNLVQGDAKEIKVFYLCFIGCTGKKTDAFEIHISLTHSIIIGDKLF